MTGRNRFWKKMVAMTLAMTMLPYTSVAQAMAAEPAYVQNVAATEVVEEESETPLESTELPEAETEAQVEAEMQTVLTGQIGECGETQLAWSGVDKAVVYKVYRDGELLAELGIETEEDLTYSDLDTGANKTYAYAVEAIDTDGKSLCRSNEITVTTPEELIVTSNVTLTKNMTVYSVDITNATLNLNGYSLTVYHDYTQNNGTLVFNDGVLDVRGNYNLGKNARVVMQNANDYLHVKGNFFWRTTISGSNILKNGIIEVEGNFTADAYGSFLATDYHKVILSGEKRQTISLHKDARFHILELKNTSAEGVCSITSFQYDTLLLNDTKLMIGTIEGSQGVTLEEDEIWYGDYYLIGGALDLNGHTLTINGNLIQAAGTVTIGGGTLVVEGDYRIQMQDVVDNTVVYGMSSGVLQMTQPSDHLVVKGNFVTDSSIRQEGCLTDGIMEIQGDMQVNATYSNCNFVASDKHMLLLSGTKRQQISFEKSGSKYSRIANLEITNTSEEGTVFVEKPYIYGHVKDNDNLITGYILIGSATTFENDYFGGSICIQETVTLDHGLTIAQDVYCDTGAVMYVKSALTVQGNLISNAYRIELQSGQIYVNGFMTVGTTDADADKSKYGIVMKHEGDYIRVNGTFQYAARYEGTMSAGTVELKGDLVAGKNLCATGSNRFLFSGEKKQTISMTDEQYFAIVGLQNHSEEGVYAETVFTKQTLIRNGCRIRYGDLEGEYGWTLGQDTTYEGDLVLLDDTLDLNGYTLTVTGDFIQMAGVLEVHGGKLCVQGDYRIQSVKKENGEAVYGKSSGRLNMTQPEDIVEIEGSFVSDSAVSHDNSLTDGVLKVKGDVTVSDTYIDMSFVAKGNHKLLLNGKQKQTVSFGSSDSSHSRIANLEIVNESEEGVVFTGRPYVSGCVKDNGGIVSGSIAIGSTTSFDNGSFGGGVYLPETTTISGELTVEGDAYCEKGSNIYIKGVLKVKGNLASQASRIEFQNGRLYVMGNMLIDATYNIYAYNSGISMKNEADYLYVGGTLRYEADRYMDKSISAGTIELKGDLIAVRNLCATGSNCFIFSGEDKQIISITDKQRFAVVELQNHSEEGIYSDSVINRQALHRNGCRIRYGELQGEYGWTLEQDMTCDGDLILIEDTLDLNGHTLTVKGNLIQAAGEVAVHGGSLFIQGDYRMQNREEKNGEYIYGNSSGSLKMLQPEDIVEVTGNFITDSVVDHTGFLKAGTLKVGGDVIINNTDSAYDFVATEDHTLVLNGTEKQKISFKTSDSISSRLANLEISHSCADGIEFETKTYISGHVNDNGKPVSGYIIVGSETSFEKDYFGGSLWIQDAVTLSGQLTVEKDIYCERKSRLILAGTLVVGGNLTSDAEKIEFNNASMFVKGNMEIKNTSYWPYYNNGIYMQHEADYLCVEGNLVYYPDRSDTKALTAGTIELKGDLIAKKNLAATGSNRFLFSGEKKQTITITKGQYFSIVDLQNNSREGVYSATMFEKKQLIRNNCRLTYGDGTGTYGWTLEEDYICEGDLVLWEDTLDLNGHTLTVTGDLIQNSVDICLNGGTLYVQGDYRLQNRAIEEGVVSYSASYGQLLLKKNSELVKVDGDFIFQPAAKTKESLTSGSIEIKGDFQQLGECGYEGGEANSLIFAGTEHQLITAETAVTTGNLQDKNSSGLTIDCDIYVEGTAEDKNHNITGTGNLYIEELKKLQGKNWSGSVCVTGDEKLTADYTIGGVLTVNGVLHTSGYKLQTAGVILNSELYVEGSELLCDGEFAVKQSGKLIMQENAGYVLVGGNFRMESRYSHEGCLTDGVLEIRGNFTQKKYQNFIATENHTTILGRKYATNGRDYIQTISFEAYAGTTRFHKLIMKKQLSRYQFQNDIKSIADEIIYEEEDTEAPTEVSILECTDRSETQVSISYSGAEDDSGVMGYEIYRDGKRIAITSAMNYTDNDLLPDTEYVYTVYAFDAYRNIASDSPRLVVRTKADTEAPKCPTGLRIAGRTGSSITLSWDASTDNVKTTGYILYRDGEVIADDVKETSYRDENLQPYQIYCYYVAAKDAAGNASDNSEKIDMTTGMPKLTSVTPEDGAAIGGDKVMLSAKYENVGNSTGNRVKIEHWENGDWEMITPTLLGQKQSGGNSLYSEYTWDISSWQTAEDHRLRYTLYDADGNTDTREVTYYIDREAPKCPEDVEIQADNGTIVLSWGLSASGDCTGYRIYRYREDAVEKTYELLAKVDSRTETTYRDNTVEAGKTYRYVITAIDGFANESEYSKELQITADEDKEPPVITNMTPRAGKIGGETKLEITAKDNQAVQTVFLEYKKEGEERYNSLAQLDAVKGKTEYLWNTSELTDGVYIVKAQAVDKSGNRNTELFTRRYEIDNTGIEKIVLTKYTELSTVIQLRWEDVKDTDFAYFQIEQKINGIYQAIGTVADTLGYTVSGLTPGMEYCFQVVGYDQLGNRGVPSDEITIATSDDTRAPAIEMVGPVMSYYRDSLPLEVRARDNNAVAKACFSYSLDGVNFEKIAEVTPTQPASSVCIKKDLDITDFPEGEIYIRFEVYDTAGNKNELDADGKEIVCQYTIDRTPPLQVIDLRADGTAGCVALTWAEGVDKDIQAYRIYRAEAENDIFRVLEAECTSKNYYDTEVTNGASYIYKIAAIDIAGNEGACSAEVFATVASDKEAPVIKGISPENNTRIGKECTLEALVMDNAKLKSVLFEYCKADDTTTLWNRIAVAETQEKDTLASVVFHTEGLEDGEYLIRATATDAAGNVSEGFQVSYILDTTAPKNPILLADNGHFQVQLKMKKEQEDDFSHYEIYRREVGETTQKKIATTKEAVYDDKTAEPYTIYLYQVAAYDDCGNQSWSKEAVAYADSVDVEKPIAALPERMVGIAGKEISFDAMASMDNVRIIDYSWNMGDGTILSGSHPVHTYKQAGFYSVILTVHDAAGNESSVTTSVCIQEETETGYAKIKIVDSNGLPIPYAMIYIKGTAKESLPLRADGEGVIMLADAAGEYQVAAYQTGYLPNEKEVVIYPYEEKSYTLVLQKDELIVGGLHVRRMNLSEMQAAGVNFSAPENYHTYKFELQLTFQQKPIPITIEYVTLNKQKTITIPIGGDAYPGQKKGTSIQFTSLDIGGTVEEPILAYISTTQSVSWLKEMYSVGLGVINAAEYEYSLEDCMASLQLPTGVSLATLSREQSLLQSMGTIRGQEIGFASWVVRGDDRGTYRLAADFSGTLLPFNARVKAHFEAEEEFEVQAGEGLHIYIMPEEEAYIDEDYYIQFQIQNESDRTFYNLTTTFGAYEEAPNRQYITDYYTGETTEIEGEEIVVPDPSTATQSTVVQKGQKLTLSILKPGESYYGTYKDEDTKLEGDKEKVYYKLIDHLVKELEGENLGVAVTVLPYDSHIKRSIYVPNIWADLFADPVDMTSGAFTEELTALSVTGATELSLDASYNSTALKNAGEMGYGWHHDYEAHIEQQNGTLLFYRTPEEPVSFMWDETLDDGYYGIRVDNKIIMKQLHLSADAVEKVDVEPGDGETDNSYTFKCDGSIYVIKDPDGIRDSKNNLEFLMKDKIYRCTYSAMKDWTLTRKIDGTYVMQAGGHGGYTFDAYGRLTSVWDENGKTLHIDRTAEQVVIREDISGKKLIMDYNEDGRIEAVYDGTGRSAHFTYEDDCLTSFTNAAGETLHYVYDQKHQLIREEMETQLLVNCYDDKGRVLTQTNAMGESVKFIYEDTEDGGVTVHITDEANNKKTAQISSTGQLLKVVDTDGSTVTYGYDSEGRQNCEIDAYGKGIYRAYDENGNMIRLTDTGGQNTYMTYDENGNVLTISNGDEITGGYTYDENNLLISRVDSKGLKTTYNYDENGLLIKETTDGLGSILYTYENGMRVQVTDYNGNVTRFQYDDVGNLICTSDVLGIKEKKTYDSLRRISEVEDANGKRISYTYDKRGNIVREVDSASGEISYKYDNMNHRTAIHYPDGTGEKMEYDVLGNCTKKIHADGTVDSYNYDTVGNLIQEETADGSIHKYKYDLLSQCILAEDGEGNETKYSYYPNGNLKKTIYPDGSCETRTYNSNWKLTGIADRRGNTTAYTYDAMANITSETDPLGNRKEYEYDIIGRLIKETDANGNVTTYTYDANSNCISKTNADQVTAVMEYDARNRMTGVSITAADGTLYKTSYEYDKLDRVIADTDEEGNVTRREYDIRGNLVKVIDANGHEKQISKYDEMGRLIYSEDALHHGTTYSYDTVGNLVGVVRSGQKSVYSYNAAGRLTKATDALDGTVQLCYDKNGNITTVTDTKEGTTTYAYDSMNRVTQEVNAVGSRYTYTYNAVGLLAERKNARNQKTTYTYDVAGRIHTMEDALGTTTYTYDANGNVLTVSDASGTITRTYDCMNRVKTYTDCRGNTVSYSYDELGNLISLTYPGGEIVRYSYYKNGYLKSVTDWENSSTVYHYDGAGNLIETMRPNGSVEQRTYDAADQLIRQREIAQQEILHDYQYTYDSNGNITEVRGSNTEGIRKETTELSSAEMTYDAANRMISYNGEKILYDADGNMIYGPVDGQMTKLTYDCRNRLISAGGVTYTYDAENNRISAETEDIIEEYVTDMVSTRLSRILTMAVTDKETNRKETTRYLYGNGLICEQAGNQTLYHHYNQVGSTTELTDADGRLLYTYSYGTYGELLNGNKTITRFLYNGQYGVSTDSNGLYYMRQRYYSPQLKRFLNQDIVTGDLKESQSLNRYCYVQGNPVSLTDPFGLSPLENPEKWLPFIHTILDVIGCIPGPVGMAANLINGILYFLVDHDPLMGGLSMLAVVTAGASKLAVGVGKAAKTAQIIESFGNIVSNAASFLINSKMLVDTALSMKDKYNENGQVLDSSFAGDAAQLALSALGMIMSGKGALGSGKNLKKGLERDDWWNTNGRNGAETELFLPDEFYNKNLPSQVAPGTKYLPKYDEFGNVKQIKMYDNYGREIGWVDYTNHGYGDINSPHYHTTPHWHEKVYNAQYRDGIKINHRTDVNTPLGDK